MGLVEQTVAATRAMMIPGATKQVAIAGMAPVTAVSSEATAIVNAMRGRTNDKRRLHLAVIDADVPTLSLLKVNASLIIDSVIMRVEEGDFIQDCGVTTFFAS